VRGRRGQCTGHGPGRPRARSGIRLPRRPASPAGSGSRPEASGAVKFEAPRGTHDILPSEQPLWQRVLGEAERLCALYGYQKIVTPGIEDTELFVRTSGQGSDVVQKEMYTFEDRGGRSLTLRPEATAPICRAYLEHGMHRDAQPVKVYTVGPMWRYDRPQKVRYREHWQLSVEAIGSDDPAVDAELLQLYDELLRRLGVTDYVLELNSIGDANCRPAYLQQLEAWLDEHDAELDDEARAKRQTTPLRVFDVKSERVQAALADAPKIGEALCDACREHFEQVRAILDAVGVRYELRSSLVRGLDYYTRTTFEFKDEAIGAQDSICGGGRYDGLIEAIGGPSTPAIGFGAGIERLLVSVGETEVEREGIDVFFVADEGADRKVIATAVAELRRRGLSADMDYAGRSVKGQWTQAGRLGARRIEVVEPGRQPDVDALVRELRG
jgi:histidyl-tRNA synthetase